MHGQRPSNQPDQWLSNKLIVKIDRPLGSKHPRHSSIVYALNYGYVPDTLAADGHGIDAYLIGIDTPVEQFEGRCIAMIHRRDDVEDKLVVAPEGREFRDADIIERTRFQEQFFDCALIR